MMTRDVARRIGRQMVATGDYPMVHLVENLATKAIWIQAENRGGVRRMVRSVNDWIELQETEGRRAAHRR